MAVTSSNDIDVEALRAKYSRPRADLLADAATVERSTSVTDRAPELKNPMLMCQQCQAHGIVKKQYGFRVIDEQCDKCGGEGIIMHRPTPASGELREKIFRVEAMISELDSIEDLERLEAALKERTLAALDKVLSGEP